MDKLPIGRGVRIDRALSNLAVAAFAYGGENIAEKIFKTVKVKNESDKYYVLDKQSWLKIPDDKRSRETAPNEVVFRLSNEKYDCQNWALRSSNAKEDLSDPEHATMLRKNSVDVVVQGLLRARELRVATKMTDSSNFGESVALTGNDKFSDYVNSDPVGVGKTARAAMRARTGLLPNVAIMDYDTMDTLSTHPAILDMFKYNIDGSASEVQIAKALKVGKIIVGKAVYSPGEFNAANQSTPNIWGNNLIFAYLEEAPISLKTKTFSLGIRWTPKGFPASFKTVAYDHYDQGVASEFISAGYYGDEKIIAKDLGYLVSGTL